MVLKGSTGVSAHRLQQMRGSAGEAEKIENVGYKHVG